MASHTPETLKTTERSLDVAKEIQRRGGASVEEIANELDVAQSTAYKHLDTLERRGYLVKEDGVYHIGLKFTNRGEYARSRKTGYRIAARKVTKLAKRASMEADFIVENDGRGMTLHVSHDTSSPIRERSIDSLNKLWRPGTYYHLHCTAGGKAVLSGLSKRRVDEIVDQWGLPQRTEQTITDRDELSEELERIRERGIAYSFGEYADGLTAVAKRISTPFESTLGSVVINAPSYQLNGEGAQREIESILTEVATSFERELEDVDHPDPFSRGSMA